MVEWMNERKMEIDENKKNMRTLRIGIKINICIEIDKP
jgi:hypothetical protein